MSYMTKIILRTIMQRVRNKLSSEISEEQFGFKNDCGTRDAMFILRYYEKDQSRFNVLYIYQSLIVRTHLTE